MVGHRRPQRTLCFIALVFIGLAPYSNVQAAETTSNKVWFSDHKALKAVDTATNQVTRVIPIREQPRALAVDPTTSAVWSLSSQRLKKFNAAGVLVSDIDLDRLGHRFDRPKYLALNPYNGAVWAASEHDVLLLSASGEKVGHWRSQRDIEGIGIDIDESLWVLGHHRLTRLSRSGSVLSSIDFDGNLHDPDFLAVDGLGGIVWVASERRLLRVDINDPTARPRTVGLPERHRDWHWHQRDIRALEIHPVFGTLWLATDKYLALFDRDGALIRRVDLPRSIGKVNAMVFDPRGLSLWIGTDKHLLAFSGNGEWRATISVDKEAERVAVTPFVLTPTLSITEPSDGNLTNNPRPTIRLSLGASCTGIPCLMPESYLQSLSFDIALNGTAIGSLFGGSALEPTYVPATRLPEGQNVVTGSAVDLFGHRSAGVTTQFVIDTIAPQFLGITPADGSTVTEKDIVIRGSIDDAAANVVVKDGDGNAWMAGPNFSFAVTLKSGVNAFTLTARDGAGNETSIPLRINFNPLNVKIASPVNGATVTPGNVVVSGEFRGPANTGITINGTVALIIGNNFYANLSLGSGINNLTATATTQDGNIVTDSISVTVNDSNVTPINILVHPASGIAPLTVRFSANSSLPSFITRISVDVDGDGSEDKNSVDTSQFIEHVYTTPGAYRAKITVSDTNGGTASQTVAVVVLDAQQMDTHLRDIYTGMLDSLRAGNVEAALANITGGVQEKYRAIFLALRDKLPTIVDQLGVVQRGVIGNDMAEYLVIRHKNGQPRAFFVYFIKGEDGVWRIDGM